MLSKKVDLLGRLHKICPREYNAWSKAIQRCTNKNDPRHHVYGSRGIKMCQRWRNSFAKFLADMGEVPDRFSLDRIDNDGDYEPSNCRWATWKQQANNKQNSVFITHNDKRQTMAQWAEETGISVTTIRLRLQRGDNPFSIQRINGSYLTHNNKTQSLAEWARETGLTHSTITNRLSVRKWAVKDALTKPLLAKTFTYKGMAHTVAEWAKIQNISNRTLRARLYEYKWPIEKALTTPVRPI